MSRYPVLPETPAVPRETITAGGFGVAAGRPDMARAHITAATERRTLVEAHAATEAAVRRVRAVLTGAGVKPADVITYWRNAKADHDYDYGPPYTGYRAEHLLSVDLYDLDAADQVLGDVATAGGDDVRLDDGVNHHLKDDTALRVLAREAAWADALQRATSSASLAGRVLGPVRHLREGGVSDLSEHQQEAAWRHMLASGRTTPHGQVGVHVVVLAVWDLA